MNELNKAHHGNFLHNTLPEGCAKLIIMDPPYFETKGEAPAEFLYSQIIITQAVKRGLKLIVE